MLDRPRGQPTDSETNDPFWGTAFDQTANHSSNIIVDAAGGLYDKTSREDRQRWIEAVEMIRELGPDYGKRVLKALNPIAEEKGLTLDQVYSAIEGVSAVKEGKT